ncbi:uncharacterized protein GGS25DRAFT_441093 [Hypoxylon fragiforme]|uniref:uncharacterized protein n=1 Tax=Hypoxylon fragiforme TaxID=63214 RepID=UPI0020C6E47C|nr:uncharacterized protein GGS25DRAFT_441093 [Hypoxylon fragiforme]KAI2603916.1 hypothetical protein GGS25DRAFT_441093 [Hypoxylon fragiforme]
MSKEGRGDEVSNGLIDRAFLLQPEVHCIERLRCACIFGRHLRYFCFFFYFAVVWAKAWIAGSLGRHNIHTCIGTLARLIYYLGSTCIYLLPIANIHTGHDIIHVT